MSTETEPLNPPDEAAHSVSPTIEALAKFIATRTKEVWDITKQPYLLSYIGPELKKHGVDNYKSIIFPDSLKNFVQNGLKGRVEVVVHPTQHSKVGLIPTGETFSFSSPLARNSITGRFTDSSGGTEINTKEALMGFLKALDGLSAEQIDGVKIPTSVLIRLLNAK